MADSYLMNTYAPLDVTFTHGEGLYLYDTNGKQYFDALAGIATCNLGHAHPAVTRTISEQASKLIHCSNVYHIQAQKDLAAKLCQTAGMDKVFFGNSGAEANEAAIKLARKHASNQNISNPCIIVLEGSFHGRTMATLSATGNPKVKAGFAPLVQGFLQAPPNNVAAIEKHIQDNDVVAVMLEITQGEGGVRLASKEYLQAVAKLCADNNLLFILDEIQTGNGRTGSYFAYQQCGIKPDVVTTAKGLGNGFPIGACLAQGKAALLFEPGNHGSTFGGNPLACATALTVVSTIVEQELDKNAAEMGAYLLAQFKQQLADCSHVVDIRGHGLMIGIELDQPCAALVQQALDAGLLINVTAGNTVRLLPALIIDQAQADQLLEMLCPLIKQFS